MNLRQPYEQLIAHKLRRLPAPDADASWQQMKRLLDEDEETRGGGKRNPGNGNGWWRIGIIAIILSASGWLYVNNATPSHSNNNIAKNKTNVPGNKQTSTIEKNTTLSAAGINRQNDQQDENSKPVTVAASDVAPKAKNEAAATTPAGGEASKNIAASTGAVQNLNTAPAVKQGKHISTAQNNFEAQVAENAILKTKMGKDRYNGIVNDDNETGAASTLNNPQSQKRLPAAGNDYIVGSKETVRHKRNHNNTQHSEPLTGEQPGNYVEAYSPSGKYVAVNAAVATGNKDWLAVLSNLETTSPVPAANTTLSVGDSIERSRNTANLLSNETKKVVAKAQRDKELEAMTKKEHKLFHLDLSNAFKPFSLHMDAEPRWAAGIALNNNIMLGAQNRFNYSMNAKSGALTDYIPSLYLQFHLNDYVFAQTELNFVSPQYTPQLPVFQQNTANAQAGTSHQKSIFIQKLYYFSVPVSLHYSPLNNLYFSAGLQFSSFQSGLATIQEKEYNTASGPDHPTSISNTVLKFKDDSIAAKLAPNEWRWQAGAEYYFNRFTVGMRYNRSFKNLVTSDAAASVPAATGLHNQSMILFVRYNLFESRKKGEGSQKN